MNHASPLSMLRLFVGGVFACWGAVAFAADDSAALDSAALDFFETRIRPVLVEHCYECHSDEAEQVGGKLWLDSADAMRSGGDSGPAIVPGEVEASVLISALRYESSEMPPSGKLSDQVIADFKIWIERGAVDPRPKRDSIGTPIDQPSIDIEAGRKFWAFQPLPLDSVSQSRRMTGHQIDAFLDAEMQAASVVPNPPAPLDAQLRRLAFDLTGLPPTPEMMNRWRSEPSEATWQRIADDLIASPAFAEHWARHWMDVARYADTNGSDFNATFHDAWRYRDYLIRHIAADTPIDEMIRQQVAGDLMKSENDSQRNDNLVATTFLMLGTKMLSERDKPKLMMDVVDEQIDTVGRAFMGLTLGCARCHDHKFDPVPTSDYYAMAGIFRSSLCLQGESQKYVSTWKPVPLSTSPQHRDEVLAHQRDVKRLQVAIKKAEADKAEADKAEADKAGDKNGEDAVDKPPTDNADELASLKKQLADLVAKSPTPIPTAMAVVDQSTDQIRDCPIHIRGEVSNQGSVVERGFLQVCGVSKSGISPSGFAGSGRLELAAWLTTPNHPLTPRVAVNRVWMHLMGEGIVRTVDNFGTRGERPTHPELLDALAIDFILQGWSRKRLVRQIVRSQAYRRSSDQRSQNAAIDPENRLLWRANRKRLPAESLRDAMLSVAGTLQSSAIDQPMQGYGVLFNDNTANSKTKVSIGLNDHRRTIYLPVVRGEIPPLLAALDIADSDLLVGKRPTTNVPAQALALLGSPEVRDWAKQTATRMIAQVKEPSMRIDWLYEHVLQRSPAAEDRELVNAWLQSEIAMSMPGDAERWASWIAAMFASTEFRVLE